MKIVLLGPVGSGKGTMANLISEKYNIPHISTGDIFRLNIKNQTELGKIAKSYIDKGELVPDELTDDLVADRLKNEDCKNGYVLDGYPRNISQANALNKIADIDLALLIDLSEEEIIRRLSSRRICSKCNVPTQVSSLVDGKCEKCGGEVFTRDDDKVEVIKNRLVKQAVSKEVIEFYKQKGLFDSIISCDGVEENFNKIINVLNKKGLRWLIIKVKKTLN